MEQLKGKTFTSHLFYDEGTELVAIDENNQEHVVKVLAVGQWGILWKHVIEFVDEKFANLY